MAVAAIVYPYVWHWKKQHPERHGQKCRVVGWAKVSMNITVEFEDGERVDTMRHAIRRVE